MEEKKRNRNALRSRALLRQAYLELIKTKKSDQITVTELVREAGLNRATFYAHYTCIRDIVEEMQQDVLEKLEKVLKEFEYPKFFENPTQLLLQISIFLGDDENFYRTMLLYGEAGSFVSKLQELFFESMMNDASIPDSTKASKSFKLRLYYFAGGIVNVYISYFYGRLDCSIYDIPLIVADIVKADFVNNVLSK